MTANAARPAPANTLQAQTNAACNRQFAGVAPPLDGDWFGEQASRFPAGSYQVAALDRNDRPFVREETLLLQNWREPETHIAEIRCTIGGAYPHTANITSSSVFALRAGNQNVRVPRKIHEGDQNKHIRGSSTFDPSRSELTYPNPNDLIRRFAGRGQSARGIKGWVGYRERVDFGENIGFYRSSDGRVNVETTVGVIHYSKNGLHIVPARPKWMQ
jgi:hypothetical protein